MTFAIVSYGLAALAFTLLAIVLVYRREPTQRGRHYLVLVGGTAVWSAAVAALLPVFPNAPAVYSAIPDALRALLWTLFLMGELPGESWRSVKGTISGLAIASAALAVAIALGGFGHQNSYIALLVLSTFACLAAEQVIRNSTARQRKLLRSFHWTVAAVMAYDLFVFADAALFGTLDTTLWVSRGLLAAAAVPVFLLAAKKNADWAETLFISRQFIFYSATLLAVGSYLIAMAFGGLWLREQGGEWGGVTQLVYLAVAFGLLAAVLSSAHLKAQLRVFISKHFYRNRYDYRDEWLRLIGTLTGSEDDLPLDQRSIKALCNIVGGPGGQMWLDRDGRGVYEPFSSWQAPFPVREYPDSAALVQFLKQLQWVIDAREYERDPEHYQHAFRDAPEELPEACLVVPLLHQREMLGFVVLRCPPDLPDLNFEDHDLLKTAGRQVVAFLAHDLARERLDEARRFDAYHRLSAFVMHDLKNVLAQQALLVDNARRFRDRPGFVDDVVSTVDHGVQRMRRLLRQLEQGPVALQEQRVELNKLILRAVSLCSESGKAACSFENRSLFWVRANAEQLTSVITHVIRNAQDASPETSVVVVRLDAAGDGRVLIEVRDTGSGMSQEFIRRRLFKPFETTKGSSGMGIGAYQARVLIRGLGGELSVTSDVGEGTVVSIVLPQSN